MRSPFLVARSVLSQSSAKVSAGFTNVSGQAIAAFVHCIVLPVHHPNRLCP